MNCVFDSCEKAIALATETKGFGIFYSVSPKTSLAVHVHDCCEVFLALSEGTGFLIDGRVYEVKRGDLFVVNPFEAHKVSAAGLDSFERYSLHVHPSFLYENSTPETDLSACFYAQKKSGKVELNEEELAEALRLIELTCGEREYGDELYKRLHATELLLLINRVFAAHKVSAGEGARHEAIGRATAYIHAHYAEDISLKDIAEYAYLSVNQLTKLFRKYCSTTVGKYLVGKRISEAKKLLAAGKSVTDAAFESGFNDYANFIRTFKSAVGVSPGRYKTGDKVNLQ